MQNVKTMSDKALDLATALDKSSIFKRWKINPEVKGDKNQTLKSKDRRL